MRTWIGVLVVLSLLTVPTAAADHLDEEGDRVAFDYVNAIPEEEPEASPEPFPDRCTRSEDPLIHPLDDVYTFATGEHYTTPVVEGGLCIHLDDPAAYEVTAESDAGEPVRFDWYVRATYASCQGPHTADGSVVVEITTEINCNYLVTDLDPEVSRQGTIAVERLS